MLRREDGNGVNRRLVCFEGRGRKCSLDIRIYRSSLKSFMTEMNLLKDTGSKVDFISSMNFFPSGDFLHFLDAMVIGFSGEE